MVEYIVSDLKVFQYDVIFHLGFLTLIFLKVSVLAFGFYALGLAMVGLAFFSAILYVYYLVVKMSLDCTKLYTGSAVCTAAVHLAPQVYKNPKTYFV